MDLSVLTGYETEAEQLEAVKNDGYAILHIQNPSEAVCLAAVKNLGCAIQYIQNPSEAVCLAAVKQSKGAFKYFKAEWFDVVEIGGVKYKLTLA